MEASCFALTFGHTVPALSRPVHARPCAILVDVMSIF